MNCPDCDIPLRNENYCPCGWKPETLVTHNHNCSYHGCKNAGTMAATKKACDKTRWYCGEHYNP